jgi:hypothetical protein
MISLLAAAEKWDSSAMPFSCVSRKIKYKNPTKYTKRAMYIKLHNC